MLAARSRLDPHGRQLLNLRAVQRVQPMTIEQLCALALAAIDDADARVVLADGMLEIETPERQRIMTRMVPMWMGWDLSPSWASAIAAVLLFGDWPTRWPLAQRCEVIEFTEVQLRGHDGNIVRFITPDVLAYVDEHRYRRD